MLAPPRPFWSVTTKLTRLSTLTSVSVSGLNNLQISWETSQPVLMNMNWKNRGVILPHLTTASLSNKNAHSFKLWPVSLSTFKERKSRTQQSISQLQVEHQRSDRAWYWWDGVVECWPDLCDNLNVESPDYQIISQEAIDCTEWDLLGLWLSGRNNLPSKYEEKDTSDLHPVWSHSHY